MFAEKKISPAGDKIIGTARQVPTEKSEEKAEQGEGGGRWDGRGKEEGGLFASSVADEK